MATFSGSSGDDIFTGGIDNDSASGGGGNDRLSGSDGADTLTGGAGADTLDGGAGDDRLSSGEQPPSYNLPYSNNPYVLPQLDTGTERDSLVGGDGSDRIFAGYGDHVDGGANGSYGDYIYISFMGAPSGVTADFGLASQTIGGAVIRDVENVSYVQGSQFGDNLNARSTGTGYSEFNAVSGMGGNDTLTAGYYTGSLFGDDGDDFVDGRPSQYIFLLDGGAGNDTLYGTSSPSVAVNGGSGDDAIFTGGGARGGSGDDVITLQFTYYTGSTVYGDEGNDRIVAATSGARMIGGSGSDTLLGGGANDVLYSGDGVNNGAAPGDDNGLERDRLQGDNGDDTLAAGFGDDIDGGGGNDVLHLSFGGATQGANVDLSGLASGGSATVGGGLIQGVESLVYLRGSDAGDTIRLPTQGVMITVNAAGGDDTITSQGSSASVLGGAGNDRLISGPAADTFDGGTGSDVIDYAGATAAVIANLRGGSGGSDTLFSVEGVIGSGFADTLVGSGSGSTLSGGGGDDRIEAGARDVVTLGSGADLLHVGAGSGSGSGQANVVTVTDWTAADRLQFGSASGAYVEATAGDYAAALQAAQTQAAAGYNFVSVQVGSDVYVFGQPVSQRTQFDAVVKLSGATLDSVSASNVGLTGPLETPQQPGPGPGPNPTPTPGGGSNIPGTGGADNLDGTSGADTLAGGDGADVLQGRGGDDRLDGGAGVDEAVYLNAPGGVTVDLGLSGAQATGDGADTLISIENISGSLQNDRLTGDGQANLLRGWAGDDTLTGAGGADTLDAREGADVLSGGDGDDRLMGHMGADTLSGGAGADIFEFNLTGDAAASSALGGNLGVLDRILDWSAADFLQFWGAASANAGNYREITASSYDSAHSQAQGAFSEFGVEYTVARVGNDVIVFAARHNQAVVLSGRTLDDISLANVGPTPGATSTPQQPGGANLPTAGNDVLTASAASPTMMGGAGDDTISAGSWVSYLRGDDGNDSIAGGSDFDDINGNMGADTATGGNGDDWVVGGKDNDRLSGDAGADIVYGNLGADTCEGGDGADIVRGGQDNDLINGGAGDDYVSGDKGDDTVTGGAGADLFHSFGDAGIDRVLDFSVSQGDRVFLDPGTQYTVAQVGADTVINMTGGGQMILVGVQMGSLPTGWIFGA
ncbi:MAG: calcium-binding protein [Pseudomonadota bacterium]